MVEEVSQMALPSNQSRYRMYSQYTKMKYGSLGSGVRKEVDRCVQYLIIQEFPVAVGKRKRGFLVIVNDE